MFNCFVLNENRLNFDNFEKQFITINLSWLELFCNHFVSITTQTLSSKTQRRQAYHPTHKRKNDDRYPAKNWMIQASNKFGIILNFSNTVNCLNLEDVFGITIAIRMFLFLFVWVCNCTKDIPYASCKKCWLVDLQW